MIDVWWDMEDDPDGNYQHVLEHGVTPDEVEEVLNDPMSSTGVSRSTGSPITFGWTSTDKYVAVVYDIVEDNPRIVRPITAYPVPEPKSKGH